MLGEDHSSQISDLRISGIVARADLLGFPSRALFAQTSSKVLPKAKNRPANVFV